MWAIFGPAVGWSFIGTGPLRLAPPAREPDRCADGAAGLRVVRLRAQPRELAAALLDRARSSAACGAASSCTSSMTLPVGPAGARGRPRARHRGLPHLHRGLDPRAARSPARTTSAATTARPTCCSIRHDHDLATLAHRAQARSTSSLFVIVLVRLTSALAAHRPLERLQLTPVYVVGLLTFLLVDRGHRRRRATRRGGRRSSRPRCCRSPSWPGCCAATSRAWTPSCARAWRSCAPRARGSCEAGDTERRRLERDLHDGAQARLVGLTLLLGHARRRVTGDSGARPRRCSTARSASSRRASPSCASSRAGSIPRSSPTSGLEPRAARARLRARPCR